MSIDKIIGGRSMEDKLMRSKKTVIIALCAAIFLMAVGFAAFSSTLTITGTANVASDWKVVFTNIAVQSKTDGATSKTANASGTSATFDVGLTSPGDRIVYTVTVENQGTLDAIIENIVATASDNPAIDFEISNIKIGDTLTKKTSTTFNVTISYDANVTTQPDNTSNTLTVDITYVQNLGQTINQSDPTIQTSTTLVQAILKNNTPQSDVGVAGLDRNGLYYTNVNTEGNGTTYYFSGDVQNNYVEFGNAPGSCTYNGFDVAYFDSLDISAGLQHMSEEQCLSTNVCLGGLTGLNEENCNDAANMFAQLLGTTDVESATCTYNGFVVTYYDVDTDYVKVDINEEQCKSSNVCTVKFDGLVNAGIVHENMTEEMCADFGEWIGGGGNLLNAEATYVGPGGYNPYSAGKATYTPGETLTWRITRINEDGSIRLVTDEAVGTSEYNTYDSIDNAHVGYMYGTLNATTYEDTHRNTNNSTIKTFVDNWYVSTLSNYTDMFSLDAGFCNDRSVDPAEADLNVGI